MIRVIVADDHAVVRKGIRQILGTEPGIELVAEAGDYGELRLQLKETACDVLILDLQMPGKHGLEILKSLRQEAPRLAVLVLSNYPEDQYAVRALKAGARGYISKTGAPERIVEAIRSLAAGRKYISPEAAEALAATVSGERPEAPHTTLSDREFQILKLIAGGRKLAEIAAELSLSPKTVSVYRARLLEKMGLASNAALTHYALKNALLD